MAFSKNQESGCAACGHEHLVSFYESEETLIATVVDYLVPALRGDDAAIVVATAEHRAAFAAELRAAGIDVGAAADEGRYQALDAADLLSRFMVAGAPDAGRFRDLVEDVLGRASSGERRVRVYGEMVALLWAEGDVTSTIALEDLWNDLLPEHGFALFCGYPIPGFDVQSQSVFEHICGQHSAVRPASDLAARPSRRSDPRGDIAI